MAETTYDGYMGVAKQATKGTAVAPQLWLRYETKDVAPSNEVESQREAGTGRDLSVIYKKLETYIGTVGMKARPKAVGALMHALLGADAVVTGTGTATGIHTHTITPADTIPWVTFEPALVAASNILVERVADCKVGNVKITGKSGEAVRFEAGFQGLSVAVQASSGTDTVEADVPFIFYDGTFTLDTGAITNITEFAIEIDNNLDPIQTTDSKLDDLQELGRDIKVSLVTKVATADITQYKSIFYPDGSSTTFGDSLHSGDLTIDLVTGTGTASEREFKIAIPLIYWTGAKLPGGAEPETIYMSAEGVAVKGANPICTVTVKNSFATDYDTNYG